MLHETTYPGTWPGHEVYRILFDTLGPSGLLLVGFALCAAVACFAIFKLIQGIRRRMPSRCPWKKDADQSGSSMTRWVCKKCKSVSFSDGSAPPLTCRAYEPRSKSL
jgi:hypothetical protein